MSSIQFNYFADEKGEQIIRQELLDRFSSLYARDYFGENKSIIKETEDFPKMPFEIYLTCEKLATQINTLSGKLSISIYDSPVVEYTPSKIRDENVYFQGHLAYFAGNEFPEFKKKCNPYSENSKNSVGKINNGMSGYLKLSEMKQRSLYPIGLFI